MVAVATRDAPGLSQPSAADEQGLRLAGFLAFVDRPKADASIAKLHRLGVDVKVITGDNGTVAAKIRDLGVAIETVLTGAELGVLADGIMEGRRIFANTLKYVLMATSSNFGNMFSAARLAVSVVPAAASVSDPAQQPSVRRRPARNPRDHVDDEVLARPAGWDISFVRRFMAVFGPVSSILTS